MEYPFDDKKNIFQRNIQNKETENKSVWVIIYFLPLNAYPM